MHWTDFKKDKTSPKDNSWILIQSSLKNTPKFVKKTMNKRMRRFDKILEKEID